MEKVLNTLRREIFSTPAFCLLLSTSLPAISADTVFEEDGIPEGFELLASPQLTVVDVYYNGRYLNAVKAVYTPTTVEFPDPEQVARMLPGLNNLKLVTEALTGSQDRHSDYLCNNRAVCPSLLPDVAGLIFDESRFRVDLVVNPEFLLPPEELSSHYLPESTSDTAFLQTVNALFTGSRSSDNNTENNETWTLFGRSMLSFQENNLESLWDYDKERNTSVRSLSFNHDKEGFSYGAGLIQSQSFGLTFTADKTMIGGRFGSSLRTLTSNGVTQSTRLEVFRSNRGRVEVFRDGRLIHSEFQEAGSQLINTVSFPSGAYEITIKQYDGDVLRDEDTRFFVKTTFLPPADEPQYFLEMGKPVNTKADKTFPETQDTSLVRSGYNWRAGETASLAIAGAATGKEALLELSGLKLGDFYQLGTSVMVADRDRYGFSMMTFLSMGRANLNLNYRRLWSTAIKDPPADDDYLLLGNSFYQGTASLGIALGKGNLDFRRSYFKDESDDRTRVIDGASLSFPLWREAGYELQFKTDVSQERDNFRILAGVELRQWTRSWYNRISYQAEHNRDKTDDATITDKDDHYQAAATWYDRDTFEAEIELEGFAEKQNNRSTLGAGIHYNGQYLNTTARVNHLDQKDGDKVTSYSGSLNTSLITDGKKIVIGGEGNTESGLLVKLNGQVKGEFDILVNGQRRGYGSVGSSTLINLPSFERYRVSIKSRGESYYEFDEREQEFALYPGNVQSFSWDIEQVLVIIGQLVDSGGQPIRKAELEGVTGVADTDENGVFQARVNTGVRKLNANLENGKSCSFELPEQLKVRRGVVLTGELICK
ncbi:hypothetical protein EOPP23_01685 [Endozoicomonas sp. OPT23]|uniref:TcfC E-set like domain-containing protein n=1 Tax=Endozoicomonas sp. OPT23 TaxID=2072845 RepID=UPI00129A0C7B|nr:CS1-pili formation C-terminal domain-containing protein [Endozoicomonas sp. OPT23]MRI31706.1 hypothetical protein [Endozoicomonas sp. OPT23]